MRDTLQMGVKDPSGLPAISPTRGEISQSEGRTFASPLARRIAKDAGLAIAAGTGSGR